MGAAWLFRFWGLTSPGDISGPTWLLPQHVPWTSTFPFLDLGLPISIGVTITSLAALTPMWAFRNTK